MPLVKSPSKEAFRKNVKAEIASGKPVDWPHQMLLTPSP